MVRLLSFVALLLVTSVSGAKRGPITRDQEIEHSGDQIIIKHSDGVVEPVIVYPTCPGSGALRVQIKTINKGDIKIQVGPDGGDRECSQDLPVPNPVVNPPADEVNAPPLDIPANLLCGRTAEGSDGGKYLWTVKLTQHFEDEFERQYRFENTLVVSCTANIDDPNDVEIVVPQDPEVPLPPFDGDFELEIEFEIIKLAENERGKWVFELKPRNAQALEDAEQEFKIVTCSATAPNIIPDQPPYSADLIRDSCIRDKGTSVDVSQSPRLHVIKVSVFRFKGNPDAPVTLQCKVALCAAGPLCPALTPAGTACPSSARSRFERAIRRQRMYDTRTQF